MFDRRKQATFLCEIFEMYTHFGEDTEYITIKIYGNNSELKTGNLMSALSTIRLKYMNKYEYF